MIVYIYNNLYGVILILRSRINHFRRWKSESFSLFADNSPRQLVGFGGTCVSLVLRCFSFF